MKLPAFVSSQVQQARRYFLDLHPKESGPLSPVCGGCERVSPDYLIARDDFPFHCIEFVAEGEGEVTLNNHRRPLFPGCVFAYGPGIAHRIRTSPQKPMLKYYVDFAGAGASEALEAAGLNRFNTLFVSPPEEIVAVFEWLQRDASSEHSVAQELCRSLLKLLLLKIEERSIPAAKKESGALVTYEKARRLLEQNALHWRTAEQAAAECGVSQEYLNRLFRKYAHTTPYRILMRVKMSRAAELLLDAGMRAREVSEELGFQDPFHFSKCFKRVFGASPDHFLKRTGRSTPS